MIGNETVTFVDSVAFRCSHLKRKDNSLRTYWKYDGMEFCSESNRVDLIAVGRKAA